MSIKITEIKPMNTFLSVSDEDSVISIGIGDQSFPLNKHPGKLKNSTGWVSRDGKMYFNEKCNGNIEGERFNEGMLFKDLNSEFSFHWMMKNIRLF